MNKKILGIDLSILAILIVLVALGIWWFIANKNNDTQTSDTQTTQDQQISDTSITPATETANGQATDQSTPTPVMTNNSTTTKPATSSKVSFVAKGVGYDETLTKFRDNKFIFQFSDCKTSPPAGTLTMKVGNQFALQNVGEDARNFNVSDKEIELPANGYTVVQVNEVGQTVITCAQGGKAWINVQK